METDNYELSTQGPRAADWAGALLGALPFGHGPMGPMIALLVDTWWTKSVHQALQTDCLVNRFVLGGAFLVNRLVSTTMYRSGLTNHRNLHRWLVKVAEPNGRRTTNPHRTVIAASFLLLFCTVLHLFAPSV